MKRSLFVVCLTLALSFASCNSLVIEQNDLTPSFSSELALRSDMPKEPGDYLITTEMAEYYARSLFKETPIQSIDPYEIDGVICLYIVNYEKRIFYNLSAGQLN